MLIYSSFPTIIKELPAADNDYRFILFADETKISTDQLSLPLQTENSWFMANKPKQNDYKISSLIFSSYK